jgi:hypothetical protein
VIYDLDRGHERSEISSDREAFAGLAKNVTATSAAFAGIYPEKEINRDFTLYLIPN